MFKSTHSIWRKVHKIIDDMASALAKFQLPCPATLKIRQDVSALASQHKSCTPRPRRHTRDTNNNNMHPIPACLGAISTPFAARNAHMRHYCRQCHYCCTVKPCRSPRLVVVVTLSLCGSAVPPTLCLLHGGTLARLGTAFIKYFYASLTLIDGP